ncbi:MAG: dipeptide epimerase [Anaerolineae bacterium]|nr:dipeptide epimerase [Anaerolineae bacterium]
MHIQTHRLALQLRSPFKLSYGATTVRENVLLQVSDGLTSGVGEAAVVPYYGETAERVLQYLRAPALRDALGGDPLLLSDALDRLPADMPPAARAAVDIALHDLWGKHLGHPLYRLWGLNPARIPVSSFTVAMADDEDEYRQRVREAREYGLIKLKLGSGDWRADLRYVQMARQETSARLCVDANGGWSADEAAAIIPALIEHEIVFIEQPVARDDLDGWRTLHDSLPAVRPPLIADESVQGAESVLPLAGLVDGINVKLAKCGGLRPAMQMIHLARACGIKVLIGCMIESTVAVAAAAHLAPLADYADLDGNLLVTNDPYCGLEMRQGQIILTERPGLGIAPAPA